MRLTLLSLLLLLSGCRTLEPPPAGEYRAVPADSLAALALDRDYVRLERATRFDSSAVALSYRALALHRLGSEADAEAAAAAALAAVPPDSLASRVIALRVQNAARASDYAAAVRLTDEALASGALDSTYAARLANERQLWQALVGVPPPEASVLPGASATVYRDRIGLRMIHLLVAGDSVRYVLDTGANLGVMIQSEVARRGLEVRPSGVLVGGVTGARVPADIAVATVDVAGSRLEAVPFLVFPDSALAFPQLAYQIEGILGLPALRALGAFRLPAGDGDLHILEAGRPAAEPTLFLDGFTPEARLAITFGNPAETFLVTCVLDTGAPQTSLLAPFYQRHTRIVEASGVQDTSRIAGAGGVALRNVWVLPEVTFTVGSTAVRLTNIPVETGDDTESSPCRVGLDVLGANGGAILDFGAGLLLLEENE